MVRIIINFLVTGLIIFLVSHVLTGIKLVDWYTSALIFSIILALVNVTLWLILRIITFPINFITFWLVWFLVSLLIIWITDSLYSGIEINWFLAYLFLAFIQTITWEVISFFKKDKK